MTRPPRTRAASRGATLVEVLVTIVIIAFGLLGMAGLQVRMQVSEMEAYQRSQALMLLNDMASRIATNRANAASYVTGTTGTSPMGTSHDCSGMTTTTRAQNDLKDWCSALQGAAEYTGSGASAVLRGAMVGARGCVEVAADGDYLITVAWQGMTPISAPPASVACGSGNYNSGTTCTDDKCRRTVTTVVRIATLT